MKAATALVGLCSSLPDGARSIAIDAEWNSYSRRLGLIQLHALGSTYLVDALKIDNSILARLFDLPDVCWVAHGFADDARIMLHAVGCLPHKIFDTAIGSQVLGLASGKLTMSLSDVVLHYCDVKLDKDPRVQRSKWDKRPLTRRQLDYAASDVQWLLQAAQLMQIDLDRTGRGAWMEEDCAALLKTAMSNTNTKTVSLGKGQKSMWELVVAQVTLIAAEAGLHPDALLGRKRYDAFLRRLKEKVMQGVSIDILQSELSALEKDLGSWRFQLVSEKLGALLPDLQNVVLQQIAQTRNAKRNKTQSEVDNSAEQGAGAANS